ncbi:hypothetical protein QQ008_05995 [Fulvivirgaceae bacterium BMA10]|uniref:TfoX N-terminal domain-containing protein n=1 Tax=Splendidivirga corallicola TaxID=3051826 RepID=A0ABT8KJM1_9BACT|nr:hypothetical protein [Fulvivirgaceae bacterium BMA10]
MNITEIAQYLSGEQEVTPGKMFGWECLKVNGNVFLTITPEGPVFKLDQTAIAETLRMSGAAQFDPMKNGTVMKEWVLVNDANEAQWKELSRRAMLFVATLPPKTKKTKK